MSREDSPGLATSAPAALAARAVASPVDPWLFHREGWDWRWRSWSRVADQVARGAAVLRPRISGPGRRAAFDGGQDPDGIAAGLAIRTAGAVAVPVDGRRRPEDLGETAWVRVEGTSPPPGEPAETLSIPAALSPLERTPPQPLELDPTVAPGALDLPGVGELSAAAVMSAARRLADKLPSHSRRPILCVTPELDLLTTRVLEAWTLHSGAAWVLEPLADAFLPTALWARPTLVCGHADELGKLAERLRQRKHRRHHRLNALALLGERELSPVAAGIFRDLGISVVPLAREAVQSLVGAVPSPDSPELSPNSRKT